MIMMIIAAAPIISAVLIVSMTASERNDSTHG
jgi:hypothetical protein